MNNFREFFNESVLVTALIGWFVAQALKVIFVLIKYKKFDVKRFVGSGGMPSSHSSTVCALTVAIGITNGFGSDIFALATVLSLVVMYDAAGVRRAAGQQAKILNKIIDDWKKASPADTEKKLKELLGHTPFEVIAGAVLGVVIAIIRHI